MYRTTAAMRQSDQATPPRPANPPPPEFRPVHPLTRPQEVLHRDPLEAHGPSARTKSICYPYYLILLGSGGGVQRDL